VGTYDVKGNQADLIVHVETILVTLVEDKFDESSFSIHVN